jgi:hypothetical protein
MIEHPPNEQVHESDADVTVQLSREEVEALLLTVDALQPLLDRLRAQIAPVPVEAPLPARDPSGSEVALRGKGHRRRAQDHPRAAGGVAGRRASLLADRAAFGRAGEPTSRPVGPRDRCGRVS